MHLRRSLAAVCLISTIICSLQSWFLPCLQVIVDGAAASRHTYAPGYVHSSVPALLL